MIRFHKPRAVLLAAIAAARLAAMDLTHASIVTRGDLTAPERKAVGMLVDEIRKRTRISLNGPATARAPVITIGKQAGVAAAEGYKIDTGGNTVSVTGADARGVLFGIGRLLREMRMSRDSATLADNLHVTSAPKYPLRGHQLGYRPKTNSYDGWDVAMWEQYIRDLAVFGTNAVELLPPRTDDAADSPHFPLPPMQMMIEMSRLLDEYGLDVWVWYPAMDKDYSDPKTVEFALNEWAGVLRQLPRLDAVFVPGGDPGHTQPKHLMALLEKQSASLHRFHPKAQMWVSPQGFTQQWMDEFVGILKTQQPAWLTGVVFGPQVRVSLARLRELVPQKYPIRHYPDITHSRQAQYPAPDWDLAYAVTEGRETINPRPAQEAQIFRLLQPMTNGFLTYSEGCNDDVNKIVWSALGWDPDANVPGILREYSRYFMGERFAEGFAEGLLALERNWQGPLLTNAGVDSTLHQFQDMERAASPAERANWRFQQALYRAYYDAYTRSRLLYETQLEAEAMQCLRNANRLTAAGAMDEAERILDRAAAHPVAPDWRARIFELAEALFQSIRMQLSVPRYQAISVDRGANLDTVDVPLNNRFWLKQRFADLRRAADEPERLHGLEQIVNWTDPGPGGYYDDLGNPSLQPHLIRGPGFARDPAFLESALVGFGNRGNNRTSWWDHAEALNDTPLRMQYSDLASGSQYKIRVVYAGDSPRKKIRLIANENTEIHPYMEKPVPFRPLEFDIPPAATAKGELMLTWTIEPGQGGNGRGNQVAEVWLIRK